MQNNDDKRKNTKDEIDAFLSQFEGTDTIAGNEINEAYNQRLAEAEAEYAAMKKSKVSDDAEIDAQEPKLLSTNENDNIHNNETDLPPMSKKENKKAEKIKKNKAVSASAEKTSISRKLFFKKNKKYDPSAGNVPGNKPWKFSPFYLIRNLMLIFVAMGLVGIMYAFIVISQAPKIDPANIYDSISENSTVYDDEGSEVDAIFYSENRNLIKYDEMPENLINAFIAIEDKTFWTHNGFNWTRMFGAVLKAITGSGQISGTSTITQQLARNVYLADKKSQRTIKRKIVEMWYASQIEKSLSKKEIIEAYLNSIYFGFGAHGVAAASDTYFSKQPSELSLVECASLAALPQAPDRYALVKYADEENLSDSETNIIMREPDTYLANDISADRRDLCLDLMLEQKMISKKDHDAAYNLPLIKFINPNIKSDSSNYSYFTDYLLEFVIKDMMEQYELTYDEAEQMLYTGGLSIYSTLDRTAQNVIVDEFNDESNFPYLVGINYDENDNIIDSSGDIMLFDYANFFDEDGTFTLPKGECKVNKDGSVTIIRGNRLNIYKTEVAGSVDYSLEFKNTYEMEDGTLFIRQGGFINIPAEFKSLDSDDNLVIAPEFFENNKTITVSGSQMKITKDAYSLAQKTIQPQAAMVIMEASTGQVKAMVGGRGATGRQLFNRTLNPRQPGSSIKPLSVYSAALQKSFEYEAAGQKWPYVDYGHDKQGVKYYGDYLTASSVILDEKMNFNGTVWPQNVDFTFRGPVTMRNGMRNSLNTVAVKIQMQVGNDYSADMLKKYGLSTVATDTDNPVNDMNPAALALGGFTNGAIPLEMCSAYTTFPNGGNRQSPVPYTKVTDRNGKVILEGKSKSTEVLDPGVAFIACDMLQYNVSSGFSYGARLWDVKTGGKSGTTNNNYDIWFDGFTPSYVGVLWIGTDVNISLSNMSVVTTDLWGVIMSQIPKAKEGSFPGIPDNVIRVGGEYYTLGTETGRSTYIEDKKREEAKKKAEEEAKRKAEEEAKRKAEEEARRRAEEEARRRAEESDSNSSNSNNSGNTNTGNETPRPITPGE